MSVRSEVRISLLGVLRKVPTLLKARVAALAFAICLLLGHESQSITGGFEMGTATSTATDFLSLDEQKKIASQTVALIDVSNQATFKTCTAILIAVDRALTAAHCVDQVSNENLFIVTSLYSSAVLERHPVIKKWIHEDFQNFDLPSPQKPNSDLAIVQFSGPLPATYHPAQLADFSLDLKNVWTVAAGYGASTTGGIDSGFLRFAKVTHPEISSSQSFFKGAQTNGSGVCHGDSGGPVWVRNSKGDGFVVVGVTSAVVGRDPKDSSVLIAEPCLATSYFNSTSFYGEWIRSTVRKN